MGMAVQAANSTPGAMSGNLHLVIRSASQMNQASDSAPGPTKRQEIEQAQAQALWARHDRMRGSRARASMFYRDRTGLEHHGDGGRSLMRACSAGDGAATAVSASAVEADRDGFSFLAGATQSAGPKPITTPRIERITPCVRIG
jgi:hypothetical protein